MPPERLVVQILQAVHFDFVEVVERLAGREPRRERRVVSDAAVHRLTADGVRLAYGVLALGGVDDQVDLVVLDHVHDVRPALAHLVHPAAGNAGLGQRACRALGRHHLEAALDQRARQLHRAGLVAVAHADEAHALARQRHARGGLRLGVGLAEGAARAHHLARGLHLRAEDRVGLGELDERKHRFLHREIRAARAPRSRPARFSFRPSSRAPRSSRAAGRSPWRRTARCARRAGSPPARR